jgi:hypothetical protein
MAGRIINSIKVDFGALNNAGSADTVSFSDWKDKNLEGTGISIETPFPLNKTTGSIPAQEIDSIISYSNITRDVEFEAAYGKYNVDQFIDSQRKALLIISNLRQTLSAANRELKDFEYKIDTVQIAGVDRSIASGNYVVDGMKVKFIYVIQVNAYEIWDVHIIYNSDKKDLCEAAERIINSVKIEN